MARQRRPDDHRDEMQSHVDLYVDDLVARGRTRADARREAALRFGNARVKLEEIEDMKKLPLVDVLLRDLQYAVRVLRRAPVFTATAILTLGLAIGANAAVFSLADAILIKSLPYPDPDRLAVVATRTTSPRGQGEAAWQDGFAWEAVRDRVPSLDAAVIVTGAGNANLVLGGAPVIARQQRVGAGYFRVVGVPPALGREFDPTEDVVNGPPVAVLSYRLWQQVYQGRPGVIGSSVILRGEAHAVVGVMPASFETPADPDVWTPVRPSTRGEGGGTNYQIVARLRPGVTWAQAAGELGATSTKDLYRARGYRDDTEATQMLLPLKDVQIDGVSQPIVLLAAGVGAVLVVACVNLAALLLARGASRSKEIATRMALGSGRRAVVRQLMVEAGVLAFAGAVAGLAFGVLGLEGLKAVGDGVYSEWERVSLDSRVVGVTFGLALLTSVVFGLVPALQTSRIDVQTALADSGSRHIAGGSRHWPRRALVVTEVALGVVLLVTAGLLLRTFVGLTRLDPGFDTSGLVTLSASLQDKRYESADSVRRLFEETLRRVRESPGIEGAAVSLEVPYNRLLNLGFALPDRPDLTRTITNLSYVTPGFLDTLRLPLRRGRGLTDSDSTRSSPAALVNEAWVRIYSADRDVLGRRIRIAGAEREIVGVTGNVQQVASFFIDGMTPGPIVSAPLVLIPVDQTSDGSIRAFHTWFSPTWVVRARNPGAAGAALAQAIRSVDPMLPVGQAQSMSSVMSRATRTERLLMTLMGLLAAAALALAGVGIHGLIGHSVQERQREFGIRIALGASPTRTMWQVTGGGVLLATVGAVIGGLLTIPATDLIAAFLWGVSARDPLTYVVVVLFLLTFAGLASLLPASRILRVDPAETLR